MRLLIPLLLLASASAVAAPKQKTFFDSISALCGQTLKGKVVTNIPADPAWDDQPLTLTISHCEKRELTMPLMVGQDSSRTLYLRRANDSLQLEHRHRLADGREDPLSRYGGRTREPGSVSLQRFPADSFTKALFKEKGLLEAIQNVWTLSLEQGQLHYRLDRPGREFEAVFELP
ncbi:hypothetical protein [Gallaecimonas xiamenensis]|uniref:Lipoprotein n=1 Tax=Gallaecimonas xiamenensis 3-C-1 TaxID=745411 RepID=K2JZ82_9GAMM|nr:hypothetical protein [Gallaecimonas xiamenensis]EKE70595.1 hypothetical protein B3C1_13693 [Gallaecimonas xiamenensis 3-C-1]